MTVTNFFLKPCILLLLTLLLGFPLSSKAQFNCNPLQYACLSVSNTGLCEYYDEQLDPEDYTVFGSDIQSVTFNGGIPLNGIVSDQNFQIFGTYVITQPVVFTNCVFNMTAGSKISIELNMGSNLSVPITFDNCSFFGCGQMWNGITINAGNNTALMNFTNNKVEDAYIGLELDERFLSQYFIRGNIFTRNYIGISNRRKNNTALNAVFMNNNFIGGGLLRPYHLSMPLMEHHPRSFAGIELNRTVASIGGTRAGSGNSFNCMLNGIYATESAITSVNNNFSNLYENQNHALLLGHGVFAKGGSASVSSCSFTSTREGVTGEGADLTVQKCTFNGACWVGIGARANINHEVFLIEDNDFYMYEKCFRAGIYVERSASPNGPDPENVSKITKNRLTINTPDWEYVENGKVKRFGNYGIVVHNFFPSLERFEIDHDTINVNIPDNIADGIRVYSHPNTENYRIYDNKINYNGPRPAFDKFMWGIGLINVTQSLVYRNEVTSTNLLPEYIYSHFCSIHLQNLSEVDLCENFVNHGRQGIHCNSANLIFLTENKINRHTYGVMIHDRIGLQEGRGNEWAEGLCSRYSAIVEQDFSVSGSPVPNPLSSKFLVKESNDYPFKPEDSDLFPNPAPLNAPKWFIYDATAMQNYCDIPEPPPGVPNGLTDYENEAINGNSTLTGARLWDLQRKTYHKLHKNPGLRPLGSPAANFYNSLANSYIASLSQIEDYIDNGVMMTATQYQQQLDAKEVIKAQLKTLLNLDSLQNLNVLPPFNSPFWVNRQNMLNAAAVQLLVLNNIAVAHSQQLSTGLQNALTANTALNPVLASETARKQYNNYRLNILLKQPVSAATYTQMLTMAQGNINTDGESVYDIRCFLKLEDCFEIEGLEDQARVGDDLEERAQAEKSMQSGSQLAINIVPQPVTDRMNISLSSPLNGVVCLYAQSGKEMLRSAVSGSEVQLNIPPTFPSGLYFVAVFDEKGHRLTSKILISH